MGAQVVSSTYCRQAAASRAHAPASSIRRAILAGALVLLLLILALPATASAAAPGAITGKVTSVATGAGVGGIEVTAYHQNAVGAWDWAAKTTTRPDGVFKITQLAAGTYRVGVTDPTRTYGTPLFYGDSDTIDYASDVAVAAKVVAGIDFALRGGSHFVGVVTDTNGSPLAGIEVSVSAYYNDALTLGSAVTAADGSYDIGGLLGWGYFNVRFHDPSGTYGDYGPYPGWLDAESTTEVSAALEIVGSIAGTVTGPEGGPSLAGVTVELYRWIYGGWDCVASKALDVGGGYTFGDLRPGGYLVGFYDSAGGYQEEYYDNATYLDGATWLILAEGQHFAGIDAKLGLAGAPTTISGHVTDEAGNALAGVAVGLASANGDPYGDYAMTDETGAYTLECSPGTLYVAFAHFWYGATPSWAQEFYNDAPDVASATLLSVGPGDSLTGVDAQLAPAAHITGHLQGPNGETSALWLSADAWRLNAAGAWEHCSWGSADETGFYDIGGLQPGTYRVRFEGGQDDISFLTEFWNDAADLESATDIVVGAGETVPDIDAQLASMARISGRVVDSGGDPLAGIRVRLHLPDGSGGWYAMADRLSDDTGTYDFGSLDAATYRLSFSDEWYRDLATEWYDDSPDVEHAADVEVATGELRTLPDVVLGPWGHIRGAVTSAGDGGLDRIDVTAYVYRDYGGWGYWEFAGNAYTDETGAYDIGALAAGKYRLRYTDWTYVYATEYYDDAAFVETATDVTVAHNGAEEGIDAVLGDGGRIQGTVTDAALFPLEGVEVMAYVQSPWGDWWWRASGFTDALGHYDVGDLLPGIYRLGFHDPQGRVTDEFFEHADDVWSATDIPLTTGEIVTGKDMQLGGAEITGTVKDADGNVLGGVEVTGYLGYPGGGGWWRAFAATTRDDGTYRLKGLPAGTYRVGFHDPAGRVLFQFYPGAPDYWAAEDITLERDETRGGIDAALAAAGRISGVVVNDVAPMPDILAALFTQNEWGDWQRDGRYAITGEDGVYEIEGLAPGTYRVGFYTDWWQWPWRLLEYYDGAADLSLATDVVVESGATTTGIDADFVSCHITGVLTDSADIPIEGLEVTVYVDHQWRIEQIATTTTGFDGWYDIGGLLPGRYVLGFHDPKGRVVDSYYDGADGFWGATYIDLAWEETRRVDAALEGARRIAGTVTAADGGARVEGITVEAHTVWTCNGCGTRPRELVGTALTDADGSYNLGIVRPPGEGGFYVLRFIDPSGTYLSEWQSDIYSARDLIGAEQIYVGKGDTYLVNGELDRAGHITGTVTNPDGTPFTAGGRVYADEYGYSDEYWTSHADIESDGSYDIGSLVPGSYLVRFVPTRPYVPEWWHDSVHWPGGPAKPYAYRIELGLGEVREDIDAVLSAPRTISGYVNDGSDEPLAHVTVSAYREAVDGTWEYVDDASTDADGFYYFSKRVWWGDGLRDGTYRLRFSRTSFEDGGTLVAKWWPGVDSRDDAEDVVVGMEDVAGIDMTMTETAPAVTPTYTWRALAAAVPGEGRPPDDSPLWRDVSSPPGLMCIASGDVSVYSRIELVNTSSVRLYFDEEWGDRMLYLQPGETGFVESSFWGDRVIVQGNDSFGRSFRDEFQTDPQITWVHPDVSVKKYVSLTGDRAGEWWDADSAEGSPTVLTGADIYTKFVVTNTGDVALSDVTLTDDYAEVASWTELPADDPQTEKNEAVREVIIGPVPAVTGSQQDVARVQASLTDDFGQTWTADPDAGDHSDRAGYLAKDLILGLREEIGASASGPWYDDALAAPVAVGSKVYYRVTVPYSSGITVTGVPVMDMKGTPDDSSDDTVIGTIDIAPGADQVWRRVVGPVPAKYGTFTDWAGVTATWDAGEETARDDATYTSQYLAFVGAYWKGHPERWGPTGFVPYDNPASFATRLGDVFKASSIYTAGRKKGQALSSFTLMQALGFREGATLNAAAQGLVKAGAAAMLNAKYAESGLTPRTTYPFAAGSSGSPYDPGTVTGKVNVALRDGKTSGDPSGMLALAKELEGYNQGIAPW